jgi:transcriptional regulator with XRE-family HTH domain
VALPFPAPCRERGRAMGALAGTSSSIRAHYAQMTVASRDSCLRERVEICHRPCTLAQVKVRTVVRPSDQDVVELKSRLGERLRAARKRTGMLQRELAGDQYTTAYVSAIEKGIAQPTIAAVTYFAERLGIDASDLIGGGQRNWSRLEADLHLAAGRWSEALDAYEALLVGLVDRGHRAEVLRGKAEALCRLNRGADAIRPAIQAAGDFAALGRAGDAMEAKYWLAYGQFQAENLTEARSVAEALLSDARSSKEAPSDLQPRILIALSHIEAWRGEHRQALAYLEEARASLATMDARRRASFLASLAVSYRDAGDMEGAIRAGAESLAFFTAANEAAHVASLENNLALAHLRLGQLGRARKYVADARSQATELNDQRLLAHVAESEAQIAIAADDLARAAALLDEAQQLALASDNRAGLLGIALTRARLNRRQRGAEAALDSYATAAKLAQSEAPPSKRREILREFADVALEAGQQERAIALYREGLADPPAS